ncbi:MAG: ABC transporter permease [Anaerolineae bacterium]|nr:ABC transporter permease [Anaerolineae bacterium]
MTKTQEQSTEPSAALAPDQDSKIEAASQWLLMWWKFRKSTLAVIGAIVVILSYIIAINAEFFAPKLAESYDKQYVYAPPQPFRLFYEGKFDPFVYGLKFERDPVSFKKIFSVDYETRIPVGLFVKGEPYLWLGFIPADRHLFGPKNVGDPFYLLGAEKSGRDLLSRIIYGGRISLTVGLVGVLMSLVIGVTIGGISGLVGGWVDNVIQRAIEILLTIPQVPILLALAAVVPPDWPPVQTYFVVSLIISLVSWTGMARVVRGRFLALRTEDFILAARLDGARPLRLILKHMLPSFLSHIIASITLSIPYMILNETFFSFLGVGLRAPAISWGILLQEARQIATVALFPWILAPAGAVVIVVLSMNFMGNGLRDAADPYST